WALVLLGIPALCVAVLWLDSYYRAVAAIRAEDDRLAKDIAAFRTRWNPTLPVDGSYLLGSAAAPLSFHHEADPWRLEEGHTGWTGFRQRINLDRWGLSTPSPDLKPPE